MPTLTQERTSLSARSGLDFGSKEAATGIEARIQRLEAARTGLWEALTIPGVEGQAGIFARLEDMQEALEAMRRELHAHGTEGAGENPAQTGKGGAESEIHRSRVAGALRKCQETLKRMDQIFVFMGGWVEDRASQGNAVAYPFAVPGAGSRQRRAPQGAGSWEG